MADALITDHIERNAYSLRTHFEGRKWSEIMTYASACGVDLKDLPASYELYQIFSQTFGYWRDKEPLLSTDTETSYFGGASRKCSQSNRVKNFLYIIQDYENSLHSLPRAANNKRVKASA